MSRGRMPIARYVERLLKRVERRSDGCWIWLGARSGPGPRHLPYGCCTRDGRKHQVHRFIYEHLIGPIEYGLPLDHLCRNTLCVNPEHLEPVTHRVNILRGTAPAAANHRKGVCKHGHPFTPENTIPQVRGQRVVGRECRTCRLEIHRRYRRRHPRRSTEASRIRSRDAQRAYRSRQRALRSGGDDA